jgi:hypothetical protein
LAAAAYLGASVEYVITPTRSARAKVTAKSDISQRLLRGLPTLWLDHR